MQCAEDRVKAADQEAAADAAWAADREAGAWGPAAAAQAPAANVYARIAELLRRIRWESPACGRNARSAALSWRENEKYRSGLLSPVVSGPVWPGEYLNR